MLSEAKHLEVLRDAQDDGAALSNTDLRQEDGVTPVMLSEAKHLESFATLRMTELRSGIRIFAQDNGMDPPAFKSASKVPE